MTIVYFQLFLYVMNMINLVKDTISNDDIDKLVGWLQTYPRLTKGPLTLELEQKWSDWIGTKYSVFCNSGSSANLLMLSAYIENTRMQKDRNKLKIVVPSVSWATDLAPIIQLGLTPILCDCNLNDLSIDLDHLNEIITSHGKIDALLLVSVLGLVPKMDKIQDICDKHDIVLLEDSCESMGSKHKGQNLGTFGSMSSFSTFFGHHISTIEGGFVSTNDKELYDLLLSLRSHGWDRDLDKKSQNKLRDAWDVSGFESLYTFYYPGYNLRSTDLNAFIGIGQIDNLNEWGLVREKNFRLYQRLIHNDYWKPKLYPNSFVSNFAYPIIHPARNEIAQQLQNNSVEVRPLVCGSMGNQPFYKKQYGKIKLPNADKIDEYGLYVPNNPKLTENEVTIVADIVNDVITCKNTP
ncbi:MAG: aminotransferase DegT [Gimesia sp.]|nr:aminotransferase DegT [Gimesia sp.]